jgi:hypothetical protein
MYNKESKKRKINRRKKEIKKSVRKAKNKLRKKQEQQDTVYAYSLSGRHGYINPLKTKRICFI